MTDHKRNLLLLVLSLAAGCVDAIAFLASGTFPANMTGNSVMLGLALVHAGPDGINLCFLALVGFCLGVIGAAWFLPSSGNEKKWTTTISLIFLTGGIFLLFCAGLLKLLSPASYSWLLVISALAMGMQSAAVLRLGVPGVSTTVITGTLTTGLARLTAKFKPRQSAESSVVDEPWLPMLSWGLYLVGGILGGIQSAWHQDWILVLPGILLVGVGLAGGFNSGSRR